MAAAPTIPNVLTIAGVDPSGGVYGVGEDTAGASLMFASGTYEVQVVVNGPTDDPADAAVALAQQLAAAQLERLQG